MLKCTDCYLSPFGLLEQSTADGGAYKQHTFVVSQSWRLEVQDLEALSRCGQGWSS